MNYYFSTQLFWFALLCEVQRETFLTQENVSQAKAGINDTSPDL